MHINIFSWNIDGETFYKHTGVCEIKNKRLPINENKKLVGIRFLFQELNFGGW